MRHFLNIDDIAQARGETTFKVARLLTRKECKLYLCFGGGKEKLLCITEQMIDGYYHLFQGKKGDYPMTLKSQHECVQRLSNNNFDLSGLSFMVGKDELRLKSVDGEDRSVFVGAKKSDIDLLPPPSQLDGTSEPNKPNERKIFFSDKFFHELVLRSIKAVMSETKDTNWLDVKRGLKNQCNEGESIQFVPGYNEEGDSVQYICFKTPEYVEPYKIKESYFKKTLSEYRKILKNFKK